jgi:two-component system phosphate regulon sensor histidine kinase PhoR
MNEMAAQLDDRIRTVLRQRNELEAVLSSMLEGVLAVDLHDRVISLNNSAAQLLGVDRTTSIGRTVQEVVRHADLQRFVTKTLASSGPVEEDLTLSVTGERNLKAYGTVLRDSRDEIIGAVFVLNDVTKLRRLEQVRQDFVANVSHELKTPITSIKGFTETLLEAGLDDQKQAREYLSIIARQADRLNAIIEDLLLLSRIEQGDKTSISTENYAVHKVFDEAVKVCQIKAQEKLVKVDVECPDGLKGRFNPPLLEQAIVNLLDNAIKYSESESRVIMRANVKGQDLVLSVQDFGPGMENQHLPRVFERFYRVDKARSRKAGGTGLGLAIVKHIALAHGGRAEVQSVPGSGSEFSLVLPVGGMRSESAVLPPVEPDTPRSDLSPAAK